ncbi:hypothetical protein [Siccirubricoccus sp. G192]|uniref:hypothetical protein n=1 Tax=Siccirubricoccus sp. G192 TaxID=2849651 RepID=UPI001C2B8D1C|nr:hypothetical protein [Siccirubricoccus sp. G192]MBV1799311.1 hypothetical protein [Siccirubricoccus sp. G192]
MTAVASTDVLIVDLNNFSCYPTIPVGLLVAALRREHWSVSVFSPLTVGVRGFARAGRTGRFGHVDAMLRFYTGVAESEGLRTLRARAAALVRPDSARSNRLITASLQKNF